MSLMGTVSALMSSIKDGTLQWDTTKKKFTYTPRPPSQPLSYASTSVVLAQQKARRRAQGSRGMSAANITGGLYTEPTLGRRGLWSIT